MALGAWVSNIRSLYKRKRQHEHEQLLHSRQDEEDMMKPNRRNMLLQSPHLRKKRQRSPRFSHLDEERIKLLEDMGFVWSSFDQKWLEMLEWAKVYGVVNYETKLSERDGAEDIAYEYDANYYGSLVEGGSSRNHLNPQLNRAEQDKKQNHTLLLDNYQQFVNEIQNPSLLPIFHPQENILELLTEETLTHDALGKHWSLVHKESSVPPSKNDTHHQFQSSYLDYRIPPNDALHRPLRIWMINQRANYNRLHNSNNQTKEEGNPSLEFLSPLPSTMTPQRKQALDEIYFPWSGRFSNRVEEIQHGIDQVAESERQQEKERRTQQKERDERERVEQLTSSIVASVSSSSTKADVVVDEVEGEVDIMALWDAEDDEDDDW